MLPQCIATAIAGLPPVVGFGVSRPEQVTELGCQGSAIVRKYSPATPRPENPRAVRIDSPRYRPLVAYTLRSRISRNSPSVRTIGLAFMLLACAAFDANSPKSSRRTP